FYAYPTWSFSSEIFKVFFFGLPHQYGQKDGGKKQLTEDMNQNLKPYSTVVD
ncbi:hypothetical protein BDB01DRAFT_710299, partial [Pilobolus umbonatus]